MRGGGPLAFSGTPGVEEFKKRSGSSWRANMRTPPARQTAGRCAPLYGRDRPASRHTEDLARSKLLTRSGTRAVCASHVIGFATLCPVLRIRTDAYSNGRIVISLGVWT